MTAYYAYDCTWDRIGLTSDCPTESDFFSVLFETYCQNFDGKLVSIRVNQLLDTQQYDHVLSMFV